MEHTPTPWKRDIISIKDILEHGNLSEAVVSGDVCVAVTGNNGEDADFIARACNAHDALVRILEKIIYAHNTQNCGASMGEASLCRAYALEAESALKLASGEA